MKLSNPRIIKRSGSVPQPYAYPSLGGGIGVALLKRAPDGLWYPANQMAETIAKLAGTPHISDHTRECAKNLGIRFEAKAEPTPRL